MKHLSLVLILLATAFQALPGQTREDRLRQHVYYFASDSLQGRRAGSPDAIKAADYIKAQYIEAGVKPYFPDGWSFAFDKNGATYRDIVGVIEGNDPALKDEYIVVGAHYDHLGVRNGVVYNGADDNASGSAAVIEMARELCKNRDALGRSIIVAAFDAEELGLFGSTALANTLNESIGKDKIKLMMSIDMVGWYGKSGFLELGGTGTIKDGRKMLSSLADKHGLTVRMQNFEGSPFTATDTEGFAKLGIPTLAIDTGLKSPYHKPEDDADLIDYKGLDKVTDFITDLTMETSRDSGFEASGKVAAKHQDKVKPLQFGVNASIGSGQVSFPKGAINGKSAFDFNGGVKARINIGKHLGIQAAALYETAKAQYPHREDPFNTSSIYRQQSLTVPALALLHTDGVINRNFIGVGPFYRHPFKATVDGSAPMFDVNPDQWGIQFSFGTEISGISIGADFRWQLNPLYISPDAENSRLNTFCFTIGYIF